MHIKKYYCLLLFICKLLLTSCQNETVKMEESGFLPDSASYRINVKPNDSIVDLEPYIDSVYYVKLELSDESIIGRIDKVLVFENRIYILDGQTSSLFIFDWTGKYLSKICRIGNGPGEYNKLNFFDIDAERRQIVLTDLMTYWNMRYDMNGNFLSRKRIPINNVGFAPLSNGKYVSFSNFSDNSRFLDPEYNIVYLDSMMHIEKVFFPYRSSYFYNPYLQFTVKPGGVFYSFDNETYFQYKMKNEVYKVTPDGLSLRYVFDYDSKNFDYSIINKKKDFHDYYNTGRYWVTHGVYETPDILSFSFFENINRKIYVGFFSKNSGNVINSPRFYLNGQQFFHLPVASYENRFISEFSPDELLGWRKMVETVHDSLAEKGHKVERDSLLRHKALIDRIHLADSLTLDDNPVLMFFKLKPF